MAVTINYETTTFLTESTANTITAGYQGNPAVLGLSSGGHVVAYTTFVAGVADYPAIDFYDASGTVINTARLPYTGNIEAQGTPAVTQLANGNVLIVWDNDGSGSNGIRGRLYTSDGIEIGTGDLNLSGGSLSDDFQYPDVTALSGGGFVVFYSDDSNDDAFVEIYNDTGVQQGGTIAIEGFSGLQNHGSLAALADGGFAVAFTSSSGLGDIYTRTYDADGTARTAGPVKVDDLGVNLQPEIAALANGNYALVYTDTSLVSELGSVGVNMMIVDANGTPITTNIQVNDPTILISESDPSVTVLDTGLIVVTWTQNLVGLGGNIMGRIFDADGNAVSVDGSTSEFVITDSLLSDTDSSVAALLGQGFVTAWRDAEGDGSGDRITQEITTLTRVLTGDGEDDLIEGNEFDEIIRGNGGDDVIIGGQGAEEIEGGDGNDDLIYGVDEIAVGEEVADGGAGLDTLVERGDVDHAYDFRGSVFSNIEALESESQADVARTTYFTADQFGTGKLAADFHVTFNDQSGSSDLIIIQMGASTAIDLSGWTLENWDAAADEFCLFGDDNDNMITGSVVGDDIKGLAGIDLINGGLGDDRIDAGAGDDIANGGAGSDRIIGQDGEDSLDGGDGDDLLYGQADNDQLLGGAGADLLMGGDGDDYLNGEAGQDDVRAGNGDDTVDGGADDDALYGQNGMDSLDGGQGDDIINGGNGNDRITGGEGADELLGARDDDMIYGGLGEDFIHGGTGDDLLEGGDDADTLNGGNGEDILHGGNGDDDLFGNALNDDLFGNAGDDVLVGGGGFDFLSGGDGNDILTGNSGRDELYGDAGQDILSGSSGSDDLYGGAGDDILHGGGDQDALTGGSGADTFVFTGAFGVDRILDWEDGTDLIDVSGHHVFDDFAEVMSMASQFGANVRIEFNTNNTLVIENTDLADLDAGDFIF